LLREIGTIFHLYLVVNFPQMNFTQLQDRLRLELLHRIKRGTLSESLLARQTGFPQSHVSNFLSRKKQFSLEATDRVLASQHLTVADLLPAPQQAAAFASEGHTVWIPVVSRAAALFEPYVKPTAVRRLIPLDADLLASFTAPAARQREAWLRFVAVEIDEGDLRSMEPLMGSGSVALLDRHYNSLVPYRRDRPNLYAVRSAAQLRLRYVETFGRLLVLRPYNIAFPVDVIELEPDKPLSQVLAGRVALVLNQP